LKLSFLIGFLVGLLFSLLYLLFGDWSWWRPRPRWAQIVLAPGLYTANWARDNLFPNVRDGSFRDTVGVVVGLLTMGLICGTLAALLSLGMGRGKGEPERT